MLTISNIAVSRISSSSQIFVVAAPGGKSRHQFLQGLLAENKSANTPFTAMLDCNRYQYGPWAGLNQLLDSLLPEIQIQTPHLAIEHDYEIVRVLPKLREKIKVRHSNLVDLPPINEPKLTYYPVERVFRIVHGMVDLFKSWHSHSPVDRWIIACDNYDRSSSLVRGFFSQLLRRMAGKVNITLLIAVDPTNGDNVFNDFDPNINKQFIKLDLVESDTPVSSQEITRLAEKLAAQIDEDETAQEIYLPQLIQYWQNSDRPQQAVDTQIKALTVYLQHFYYEDALYYGEQALSGLQKYYPQDLDKYWDVCEKLHDCYICLNRHQEALLTIQVAIATTNNPEYLFKGFNRMAMLDSRYLSAQRDLDKAEEYIELGLQTIEKIDRPPVERFYYKALACRGLAFIRHLQGRFDEAIDLCHSIYGQTIILAGTNQYLGHQALVQFNIFRIYVSIKKPELALTALSKAIEIDPKYSEYFNHRGNLYVSMERFSDALADYLKAIELSPPYPEVWTNLAQCYRQIGNYSEAVAAYNRSLELDPKQTLAFIGRAQSYELLDQIELAISDYSTALELDIKQPLVLANRATLYYELAQYNASLADLNLALDLAPETAQLYQNRAVALISLNLTASAIEDLQTYLRLDPQAEDCVEVEAEILKLQNLVLEKCVIDSLIDL